MNDGLNVVVAQSPGSLPGPEARMNWLKATLDGLMSGTNLLILPELFLTGYNIADKVSEWAEERQGPFSQQIAALARAHRVAIHFGYVERDGDSLFNSAACFGPDGALIDHHRKLLLPPGFEGDHFAHGTGYSHFQLSGFRIATLICYDAEFPENVREVAMAGADLVLVPTALGAQWGVVSEKVIPTRAFENGVFICYANHCDAENGLGYYGGSCIVGPDGNELARAGKGAELLYATLNLPAVAAAQARLPYHSDLKKLPCYRGAASR